MHTALIAELEKLKSGKLLDIGCGNGDFFGLLKGKGFELHGTDLAENMVNAAQKKYGDIAKIIQSDAENLPYQDGMFDIIICNASFHHYTNPEAVLKEMRRVLKDNGVLLIGDPWTPQPIRAIINFFTRFSDEGDYHYYGYSVLFKAVGYNGTDADKWEEKSSILLKIVPNA